jgi:hypothetical protein
MKTTCLKFGMAIAIAIGCIWSAAAQSTLTLNLQNGPTNWADTTSPQKCYQGGFWNYTYNGDSTRLQFGNFVFSHESGAMTYSYWGGFTTGSDGDQTCYSGLCPGGSPCGGSGSNDWIYNQWGAMAGGGLNASYQTVTGVPYAVAYWDYYSDTQGDYSLKVSMADGSLFAPQEVWINNHPWPYYGNMYGDGFARPLANAGDYFRLWVHAIRADGSQDSISYNLAINYVGGIQNLIQSSSWGAVPLTRLGTNVKTLYFTMESTDSDPMYGPNTAVYFDMDKLKVVTAGKAPAAAVTRKAVPKAAKAVEVTDYFPVASYTGGDVTVYDAKGKEVWKTTVKAGEKVNLSKLPAGEYRLRHGHKHIPIKKLK